MTTISSHILDSTTGQDASGIRVTCHRLLGANESEAVFEIQSGDDGRISIEINTDTDPSKADYELVFYSGEYFAKTQTSEDNSSIVSEVVVRVDLSEAPARCHVPVLIAPHNYTIWWSR
ncbi:MAG: hydroxyisourate hydrolase [Arenicellales bacterium]|nr:hydroxyisourate hydrolase [Arenicellales bacterium]